MRRESGVLSTRGYCFCYLYIDLVGGSTLPDPLRVLCKERVFLLLDGVDAARFYRK